MISIFERESLHVYIMLPLQMEIDFVGMLHATHLCESPNPTLYIDSRSPTTHHCLHLVHILMSAHVVEGQSMGTGIYGCPMTQPRRESKAETEPDLAVFGTSYP